MNALDLLRLKLHQTFTATLHEASWGQPDLMSTVLREVCSVFDTSYDAASRRSITKSLLTFRTASKLPTFLDLKYACIGISQKAGDDGWILLEDLELFPALLREVSALAQSPRRFRKCFQGLLAGYFEYNVFGDAVPEPGRKNWLALRSFLRDHLRLIQIPAPQLSWVRVIGDHRNLLEDGPCKRYGAALARGEYAELKSAFRGLAIPRNSWVWEMIVLERIKAICVFEDTEFKKQLAACLVMLAGDSGVTLSLLLKRKCIAQLLMRYAACDPHPENSALLERALALLGNPWVERPAWDAHVADDNARAMVELWLKRRLITDFFHVLARDRSAHMGRLKYWLRFIPKIEDMWFALGPYALNHPGSVFKEFREIARDRILALENSSSDEENALIMRIGDFVFVELTSGEDACLVFRSNEVPFDLDKKWIYIGSKCESDLPHRLKMKHRARRRSLDHPTVPGHSVKPDSHKKRHAL